MGQAWGATRLANYEVSGKHVQVKTIICSRQLIYVLENLSMFSVEGRPLQHLVSIVMIVIIMMLSLLCVVYCDEYDY